MAAPVAQSTLSPEVRRMLAEHSKLAAQRRARYGDPLAHFASVVRETLDQESLEEALRDFNEDGSLWNDDELDER